MLKRNFKISAICTVIILLVCATGVSAKISPDNPEEEMLNFGIIAEKVDTQNTVTFAEYSAMLLRAMAADSGISMENKLHWYDGYVRTAGNIGLYKAFSNSVEPEKEVTAEYALAMTTAALGYRYVLPSTFEAWYKQAIELKLDKGINAGYKDKLTRSDAYTIIHNALDVQTCGADGKFGKTFEEILLGMNDGEYKIGIIEATDEGALIGNCAAEGMVRINNDEFNTGEYELTEYIGSYVKFLVSEDTIKWIELHRDNSTVYIDENTEKYIEDGKLFYSNDESSRYQKIKLSDAPQVVLNNRPTIDTMEEVLSDDIRVKMIDNDGDDMYDVAVITDIESYVVETVYPKQGQIAFEYGTDAKKRLQTDNADIVCRYYGSDGEKISIDDIKSGDAISIIADKNMEQVNIYRLNPPFDGTASAKNEKNSEVSVNSEKYKYIDGRYDLITGSESTFYTDLWGRIFYARKKFDNYLYIRQKYTDDSGDNEYIEVFDGNTFNSYRLSDRVRVTGGTEVGEGAVATLKFNNAGDVTVVELAESYASKGYRTYCENDFGFVDYENKKLTPFACDKGRSKVFIVPSTNKKEDYFNTFALDNDEEYMVEGFGYDDRLRRVQAAVVVVDPDKPVEAGFGSSSKFMAVDSVWQTTTDDDEATYEVNGLMDGERVTLMAASRQSVFNVLSMVGSGDVIELVCNWNGDIGLVRQVMDFSELNDAYFDDSDYKNTELFSSVTEVNKDVMTNFKKYLVNEIKCNIDGRVITSCVPVSEEKVPDSDNKGFSNYFEYYRHAEKFEKGNIDSVVAGEYGTANTFIFSKNDDVKFIVTINN